MLHGTYRNVEFQGIGAAICLEGCTERIGTYNFRAGFVEFTERVVQERIGTYNSRAGLLEFAERVVQERIGTCNFSKGLAICSQRVARSCPRSGNLARPVAARTRNHRKSTIWLSLGHVSCEVPQKAESSPGAAGANKSKSERAPRNV